MSEETQAPTEEVKVGGETKVCQPQTQPNLLAKLRP